MRILLPAVSSDETCTPDLMKFCVVTDSNVHTCEIWADIVSFKPIRPYATEYGELNVLTDQHPTHRSLNSYTGNAYDRGLRTLWRSHNKEDPLNTRRAPYLF